VFVRALEATVFLHKRARLTKSHFCFHSRDVKLSRLVSVPPPLTGFFDASMCDKNDDEINWKCVEVWKGYNLSKEQQCASIEEATRGQSKSAQHNQRLGRTTASKTKRICSDDLANPSLSLLKDVCFSTQTYQSEKMKRGQRL